MSPRKFPGNLLQCRTNAEPLVRQFFDIQHDSNTTYIETAERAGICSTIFTNWKKGWCPSVSNFQAVLGVHGYTLKIVKIEGKENETV